MELVVVILPARWPDTKPQRRYNEPGWATRGYGEDLSRQEEFTYT